MQRHSGLGAVLLGAVVLGSCAVAPVDVSPAASASATTRPIPTAVVPTPIPVPTGGSILAASPSDGGIGSLQCDGDETSMTIDYAPDARGERADIVEATRQLGGVRESDAIDVDGGRTAVVRASRTIWIGSWIDARGTWLLSSFEACGDAGIATTGS